MKKWNYITIRTFFCNEPEKAFQELEGHSNILEGRSNIPNKAPDFLEASEF